MKNKNADLIKIFLFYNKPYKLQIQISYVEREQIQELGFY